MIGLYAQHTGKPPAQLARDLERDHYLSAQEALDYGLIDRVIEHRPDLRS